VKSKNNKNTANFFWDGELSLYEIMCIKSFLKHGFFVNLWTFSKQNYENLLNLENLEIKNANQILKQQELVKFTQNSQKNNLSSFTNMFRYKLLNNFGGWWFDTDCYCLKNVSEFLKLTENNQFIICRSPDGLINGSVMYFEKNSYTKEMAEIVEKKLKKRNNNFYWGEIGPYLLTEFFKNKNLEDKILEANYFYELAPLEFHLIFTTNKEKISIVEKRINSSLVTHLWNEMYRRYNINKNILPPSSSIAYKWLTEQDLTDNSLKKYSNLFNIRFKFPISYIYKLISRIKAIIKNYF